MPTIKTQDQDSVCALASLSLSKRGIWLGAGLPAPWCPRPAPAAAGGPVAVSQAGAGVLVADEGAIVCRGGGPVGGHNVPG